MKRKSITDFFTVSPSKKTKSTTLCTSIENPILIDDNEEDELIIEEKREVPLMMTSPKKECCSTSTLPPQFKYLLNEKDTGVQVRYIERFLSQRESRELFDCLMEKCEWVSPQYNMYGKDVVSKRKTAFFGINVDEKERVNAYGNSRKFQTAWPEPLLNLKKRLEDLIGEKYEAALINRYDDGDDLIGWHADREATGFSIASVSLGGSRDFQLRPIPKQSTINIAQQQSPIEKKGEIITKSLENGCLLVMNGTTQKYYQHCVPKRKGVLSPRINITFRDLNVYVTQ